MPASISANSSACTFRQATEAKRLPHAQRGGHYLDAGSHAPHRDDVVPQNMHLHVGVLEDGL